MGVSGGGKVPLGTRKGGGNIQLEEDGGLVVLVGDVGIMEVEEFRFDV